MKTPRDETHHALENAYAGECMPVTDDDGDLVFTSHGPRCEEITNHIAARDAFHAAERERLEARIQALREGVTEARLAYPALVERLLAADDAARKG